MSLHERLRAATRAAHDALEHGLDWRLRVATLDGYRGLLARLHGFHAAWEPAIAAALEDDSFLAPRLRLPLLKADLLWLGFEPAAVSALPQPEPVALRSRAAALGALYVFEGSSLGGQVILRHVAGLHGIAADAGGAYYGARGRRTGPLWAEFRVELEHRASDASAQEEATRAAIATFAAMRDWLASPDQGDFDPAGQEHFP